MSVAVIDVIPETSLLPDMMDENDATDGRDTDSDSDVGADEPLVEFNVDDPDTDSDSDSDDDDRDSDFECSADDCVVMPSGGLYSDETQFLPDPGAWNATTIVFGCDISGSNSSSSSSIMSAEPTCACADCPARASTEDSCAELDSFCMDPALQRRTMSDADAESLDAAPLVEMMIRKSRSIEQCALKHKEYVMHPHTRWIVMTGTELYAACRAQNIMYLRIIHKSFVSDKIKISPAEIRNAYMCCIMACGVWPCAVEAANLVVLIFRTQESVLGFFTQEFVMRIIAAVVDMIHEIVAIASASVLVSESDVPKDGNEARGAGYVCARGRADDLRRCTLEISGLLKRANATEMCALGTEQQRESVVRAVISLACMPYSNTWCEQGYDEDAPMRIRCEGGHDWRTSMPDVLRHWRRSRCDCELLSALMNIIPHGFNLGDAIGRCVAMSDIHAQFEVIKCYSAICRERQNKMHVAFSSPIPRSIIESFILGLCHSAGRESLPSLPYGAAAGSSVQQAAAAPSSSLSSLPSSSSSSSSVVSSSSSWAAVTMGTAVMSDAEAVALGSHFLYVIHASSRDILDIICTMVALLVPSSERSFGRRMLLIQQIFADSCLKEEFSPVYIMSYIIDNVESAVVMNERELRAKKSVVLAQLADATKFVFRLLAASSTQLACDADLHFRVTSIATPKSLHHCAF